MNMLLLITIISVLLCLGTAGILLKNRHIAEILICGIVWFFCSYLSGTMILFVLDVYTLSRGAAATCLLDAIAFFTSLFTCEKPSLQNWKENLDIKAEIRILIVPFLIALLGLPFVSQKNELFGMGQDEGVYQCTAINFIYGYDTRQQDFTEYSLLTSDESRKNFQTAVHNKLVGYDIPNASYPDTVYDREVSPVSGIYHGIPTYPALLALWGKLTGLEHMADVQTIFYFLTVFLICFVCNNLKLSTLSGCIAGILTACSPVVIWVAKSSLTEMFLAVLILSFLFFLTDQSAPEQYFCSFIPIAAFGCYHVSIYTILPYVLMIYAGMYFFTRKKIFPVLMLCSVSGYLASYLMMRHTQPFYTMNNYRFVFNQYINVNNLTQAVIIICIALLLCCLLFTFLVCHFRKTVSLETFLISDRQRLLMKILLAGMIILPLVYILIQSFSKLDSVQDISSLTIAGFAQNAGVFLLPVSLLFIWTFLENEEKLIIFVSFFYCILIYSALLRFRIEYYYYYARYLVPFIPVAVMFAVTAMDRKQKKLMTAASVCSLCFSLPYSGFLMTHQDDTRMEWSVLEDITEQITEQDCVVIESDCLSTMWLPVRALTGAAVYPAEKDTTAQIRTLAQRYASIYLISMSDYVYQLDDNLEILYRNTVHLSEDKNNQLSAMPMKFTETAESVYLYHYLHDQLVYDAQDIERFKLYGIGSCDKSFCWTTNSFSAVRCTLEKKHYTLTLTLGSTLPLQEMGKDRFTIRLSVNGAMTDVHVLTRQNNHKTITLDIPERYLNEGTNIISFQTDTWKASAVNPDDTRTIGIPLQSLEFQERK